MPTRNSSSRYSSYRSYPSYKPRSVRRTENKAKNKLAFTIIFAVIFLAIFVIWGLPALIGGLTIFNQVKSGPKQNAKVDEAIAPPTLNIPYDATNSAQIRISGYSAPNSKVEIYFDSDLKTTVVTGVDGSFNTDTLELGLGRNNIYGQTVGSGGSKSLPSKTIQLDYSNEKPNLTVESPNDGTTIVGGDKKISVSGKTNPQDSITVNGMQLIVSGDGSFSTNVNLNTGQNTITIVATDTVGNTNQIQRSVIFNENSPTPSPTP
jgi:hypothetical protein